METDDEISPPYQTPAGWKVHELVRRSQQEIAEMGTLIEQTQERISNSLTRLQESLPIKTDPQS